jgi:hypothetical protein
VPTGSAAGLRNPQRWRGSGAYLSWLTAIRVGRAEVIFVTLAAIVITGATLLVTQLLADARVAQGCVASDCEGPGPFTRLNSPLTDWLYPLLATLPFVVGALLGAPVVAREIESGTGRLTWSLTANRLRWLIWRCVPLIVILLALLTAASIAGSNLLRERFLIDPTYFFSDGQIRGAPLVARGLAMFGVALLAGAVWRRVLPALVVAAIAGVMLYNGLNWISVGGHWLTPDVLGEPGAEVADGSYYLTDALQAPDGSFRLASEVAVANGFPRLTPEGDLIEYDPGFIVWYTDHGYRYVAIGWDRSRYPEVVVRECALLIGLGIICIGATVVALRRARPG